MSIFKTTPRTLCIWDAKEKMVTTMKVDSEGAKEFLVDSREGVEVFPLMWTIEAPIILVNPNFHRHPSVSEDEIEKRFWPKKPVVPGEVQCVTLRQIYYGDML